MLRSHLGAKAVVGLAVGLFLVIGSFADNLRGGKRVVLLAGRIGWRQVTQWRKVG